MTPLGHIKGWAASETKAAEEQARLLIEQAEALGEPLEDPLLLFLVLYGFWSVSWNAFDGDVLRELATQFLALAEKQTAITPLMIAHRMMGMSLMCTGDIVQGRTHFDRAFALYDPIKHRSLAAHFAGEPGVAILAFRSNAFWFLGLPDAALADADQAIRDAREIGHAASLMYALSLASVVHVLCGNFGRANEIVDELVALADEKGVLYWKTTGIGFRGSILALTAAPSEAVQTITSFITACRSMGQTVLMPRQLSYVGYGLCNPRPAYQRLALHRRGNNGNRNDQRDLVRVRRLSYRGGNRAAVEPTPDAAKAEDIFQARACSRSPTASKVLGTARGDEHRAALARLRASRSKLANCSLRFTGGLPKGSTRSTSRRPRRCWTS